MLVFLLKFGAWRLAWSAVACGVVLIVLIAPAFAASPRHGDDDRNCAVAGATPTPRATLGADDEDRDDDENDEDCAAASAKPSHTPRPTATPRPSPRPTPKHTAKPASCDDDEDEHDDEGDDD
jgi:hypothetical protein